MDDYQVRMRRRNGDTFWAELNARLLDVDGGAVTLAGVWDITEQKQLLEQLEDMASTDALTGLLNRRRFMEVAEAEVARNVRYRNPLCCLMIDIDHFKSINDRHGHVVGDNALKAVATRLRNALRVSDMIGRIGGEEFAALLPETTAEHGLVLAERLRYDIETMDFRAEGEGACMPATVSIGLVQWRDGEGVDDLLRRADERLYAAKKAGRNRVVAEA